MNDPSIELYFKGMEEFKIGNYELALQIFDDSLLILTHGKTFQRKAETLEKLGHKNEALRFMALAYAANPLSDIIAKKFAEYLIDANNTDDAKEILDKIILRNPSYMPATKILSALKQTTEF